MTIFGRIVTGWDVEQWTLETLRRWSGSYLAELEDQKGLARGELARIKAFIVGDDYNKMPEDQLPAVMVISPGTLRPEKGGDGRFRVRWSMNVGVVCAASTLELARRNARFYLAAHRTLLAQRPSLEQHALGNAWLGENYDQLTYDDSRSMGWGVGLFTVEVDDVTTTKAGPVTPEDPLDPDTQPWPEWPLAETVETKLELLERK